MTTHSKEPEASRTVSDAAPFHNPFGALSKLPQKQDPTGNSPSTEERLESLSHAAIVSPTIRGFEEQKIHINKCGQDRRLGLLTFTGPKRRFGKVESTAQGQAQGASRT